MKRNLLFVTLSAFVVLSCSESAGEDGIAQKSLDIEIESGGGIYTFPDAEITAIVEPDSYFAEIANNTFVGVYAGETTAKVTSASTEYDCKITVSPSYTYYIDMAIYLGRSQSSIEALYGEATSVSGSVYLYSPLSSYLPETAVAFIYENDKVTSAASYFELTKGTYVIKHLQQRYATYGTIDNVGYFGNAFDLDDCTIAVMYNFSSSSMTYVMYSNYSSSSSAPSKAVESVEMEQYSQEFNAALEVL